MVKILSLWPRSWRTWLPLLGSDSPRDYENTAVAGDPLAGEWTRVNLVLAGSDLGAPLWVISFRDGKYTAHIGSAPETGTYTVNGLNVDMVRTGGAACYTWGHFLFRVAGDTLKLSYYNGAAQRPKTFGGKDMAISTFERVRK
jgi:hypothetical protein